MVFKIKQSSPWLYGATLIMVIFFVTAVFLLLFHYSILPELHSLILFVIFAPVVWFAFYLTKFTAIADIEITIDNEGLKRKWLRQFLFHKREDDEFNWTEISDYTFQPDRQFDQFKLHLKDGTTFKFYHSTDHDDKDEFRKFLSCFSERVEQNNNNKSDTHNAIKRGKTIYETYWGLILSVLAIIMILGVSILLIVSPVKKISNIAMLSVAYIGAIYFIIQVFSHRKRRKQIKTLGK